MGISLATIAATAGTLLKDLASIATWVGAQHLVDKINRDRAKDKKVSEMDITNIVTELYKHVSGKGSDIINTLTRKLESLPYGNFSGVVKSTIAKERSRLTNNLNQVEKAVNEINTQASNIEKRGNVLSSMSDSYRTSEAGKSERDQLEKDAKQLIQDTSKIEKSMKELL